MSFDSLLKKREIKKHVDEGQGDIPNLSVLRDKIKVAITETPQTLLNEDLNISIQEALDYTLDTITEIVNDNKTLDLVIIFNEAAKKNVLYPQEKTNLTPQELFVLHRAVLETVNDPRALFLWDLWILFRELTELSDITQRLWKDLGLMYTKLFGVKKKSDTSSSIVPTKVTKISHYLDVEYVKRIKYEVERIRNKTYQKLSTAFLSSLSLSLIELSHIPTLDGVSATLAMLKKYLEDQFIELSDNNQQFLSLIHRSYGDWDAWKARKLAQSLSHSILSTTVDPVIQFSLLLQTIADREDVHSRNLIQFLSEGLHGHLVNVEDELIEKESSNLSQTRDIVHKNVDKIWFIKQYLLAIDSLNASDTQILSNTDYLNLANKAIDGINRLQTQGQLNFLYHINEYQGVMNGIKEIFNKVKKPN